MLNARVMQSRVQAVHSIMGTLGCLDDWIINRPPQSLAPGTELV
jgi:hypothetical protein